MQPNLSIVEPEPEWAPPAFGPVYPNFGATIQKHRRRAAAAGGVARMDKAFRHEYGAAVEAAVLTMQRAALRRDVDVPPPGCASGTPHSDGAKIAAAIRGQQSRDLLTYPARVRKARTPEQWASMYREAMAEKRQECAP